MIYQNRFDIEQIQKSGCLYTVLANTSELATGKKPSYNLVEDIYYKLNEMKVMSKDIDDFTEGAFVHDHVTVLNEFLNALGSDKKARYLMRNYIRPEMGVSFGVENYSKCNFLALQVRTTKGGHFRMLDHDPYEYGTKTLYIKSIRGYLIE